MEEGFEGIGDISKPDGIDYNRKPSVVIVMTTFNRAELLERAIRSIINQTFQDWFLVVVDDGSTDNTLQVLDKMMIACENRMSYILMPENSGKRLGLVRNEGIRQGLNAEPKYFSFIDDDNEYYPTYLEELVKQLEHHKEIDVVYCDSDQIAGDKVVGVTRSVDFEPNRLLSSNFIDLGEAMVRVSIFEKYGLFEDDLPGCGEDWGMWCKLAQNGVKFLHYPRPLYRYYLHQGQTTHDPGHQAILGIIRERIANKWYLDSKNWVR